MKLLWKFFQESFSWNICWYAHRVSLTQVISSWLSSLVTFSCELPDEWWGVLSSIRSCRTHQIDSRYRQKRKGDWSHQRSSNYLIISMFSFQCINHPESFTIDEVRISEIFRHISETVDIPQQWILNIAFLPDSEIQILNSQYRNIDSSTDVLSFHYYDDFSDVEGDEIAGEIILSESRIITQALENNLTSSRECEILVIHSILHIIGFDHETDVEFQEMWKYEEKLRSLSLHSIH